MKTINNFLSEYLRMVGGNSKVPKEEKINNLIEQITGDGSKIQEKKIISIKANQLTENNINEFENQDEFKKYLLSLKKSGKSIVHQFYSSENEF
jgi:hypothetical protein